MFKIISDTLKFLKQIFNSANLFPYFACISIDDIDYSRKLYKFIRFLNRNEFNIRYKYKSLADANITKNLLKQGFSKSSETTKLLAKKLNIKERFDEINWQSNKINKRKKWMWYFEPEIDEKIVAFTVHLAKELSGYLEGLPVVRSIYFWNSFPNEEDEIYKGSQLFHMDNNDWRQIRFFYAIEPIDAFNGSPEYIPSKISYEIFKKFSLKEKFNLRNKKRPDHFFNKYEDQIIQTKASQDESFFLDTGNCYHRGSRDMQKGEKVFVIQFMTPFHIHTKIFKRNKNLIMPNCIKNDKEARYVFQYYKNSLPQKGY